MRIYYLFYLDFVTTFEENFITMKDGFDNCIVLLGSFKISAVIILAKFSKFDSKKYQCLKILGRI